jgi:hypothetical protein
LDLFEKGIEVEASGPVPRMLMVGVEWNEAAEGRFVDAVKDMTRKGLSGKGYRLADAIRSARWMVEAWLHRQCIKRELQAAGRCGDNTEKLALVGRWRREFGDSRTEELLRLQKDLGAKDVVLKQW